MRTHKIIRSAIALSCIVALGACTDLFERAHRPDAAPTVAGIHPLLVMAGQTGAETKVEVHLRRVKVSSRIASYQGELRYDSTRMSLVSASVPTGLTGVWNEVRPGTIRLAGVDADGMSGDAVLLLTFTTRGTTTAESFALKMEEVVAHQTFKNLGGELRQRPKPLLIEP